MGKMLHQAEANKKIEELKNEMFLESEKAKADAQFYHTMKELEANERRLTPQYLELVRI